jgi:hypothetical protein
MFEAPAEAMPTAMVIVAVRATMLMTMAVVTLAVAAVMVMAEVRATAMAVTSSAASGGGDGGNGMKADVCNAILLCYADVVDVRSNNDGNCAPAFNRGNIDGGVANFNNGMWCTCGGQ